jgi:hypothetical protein
VEKDIWRDYLTNPREFDRWLKANAAVGSILAIGLLAMALAGHYSARSFDEATEYSVSLVGVSAPATPEKVTPPWRRGGPKSIATV